MWGDDDDPNIDFDAYQDYYNEYDEYDYYEDYEPSYHYELYRPSVVDIDLNEAWRYSKQQTSVDQYIRYSNKAASLSQDDPKSQWVNFNIFQDDEFKLESAMPKCPKCHKAMLNICVEKECQGEELFCLC